MRPFAQGGWILGPALVILLAAGGWEGSFAMESADCLGCHADAEAVGEQLTIAEAAFAGTPHAEMGCTACHENVTDSHPDDGVAPGKAQCAACHEAVTAEYAKSVHGGNAACVDCHNPHAVRGPAEVSGYDINRQCAACHGSQEMAESHAKWLPQTEVHLVSLPCITCHTGSEKMVLSLYVAHEGGAAVEGDFELADYQSLMAFSKGEDVQALVDRDKDQIVSIAELEAFNRNPEFRELRLHGMLMPAAMTHSYDILYNRWDCTFCHATGPGSLENSYINFPKADGTYARLPIEKGPVLAALYSTPDFYLVGSSRNSMLNVAGAMIIAGGLVMPVGHGLLRFFTRKNRH